MMRLKTAGFVACPIVATAGLLFSCVHPWGNLGTGVQGGQILAGSAAPDEVRSVVEKKCGDCHSDETRWPLYSHVAPVSWLVEHDVFAGRSAMNLSHWAGIPADGRIAALARIAAEVRNGEMPPRPYVLLHPANRLTAIDKQQIVAWTRAERKRVRTEIPSQKENQ
jgi:cytochrome c